MNITEYFNKLFQTELKKLSFEKPNSVILQDPTGFGVDSTTIFFGGREWNNCEEDLKVTNHKTFFALSVFGMVCNDLNMHAHFNNRYSEFRRLTNYPKFGWTSLGPQFETPDWLIIKPLNLGLVSYDENTIQDFVKLWKLTANNFFSKYMSDINPSDFFHTLCEEKISNQSETLIAIKNHLLSNNQ